MPYRTFNLEEVARYLHLARPDLERLVKQQAIPFEKHGDRLVFRKVVVDAWASQRILGLHGRRLADYHEQSSSDTRELLPRGAMMPALIEADFIDPELPAKTKSSVLRQMVALADKTGRVWDAAAFRAGLEARESLCPTAIPGGLALLHARSPEASWFESPFLVLGRTVQDIHFGSPDGRPTRLFFLLGCPDDRLHLHTLARVCLMAQKTDLLAQLQEAATATLMQEMIVSAEESVLEGRGVTGAFTP